MTKPNIHQHTAAICKKLGLDAALVRELTVTPRLVVAEVYLTDANGSKYIKDDGNVALEKRTFEVSA